MSFYSSQNLNEIIGLTDEGLLNNDTMDIIKNSDEPQEVRYKHTNIKWVFLVMLCLSLMGNAYSIDFPAYLKTYIIQTFLSNSSESSQNFQYNLLYSVYTLPNIAIPLFGGVIVDRIGTRNGLMVFASVLIISQSICTLAAVETSFTTLLIGRAVFGLGTEMISISGRSMLSLANGCIITMTRLASVSASVTLVPLYKAQDDLLLPIMATLIFCSISFIAAVIASIFDRRSQKFDRESLTLVYKQPQKVVLADLKKFRPLFFLVSASITLGFCSIFPLVSNLQTMLNSFYNMNPNQANHYIGIPFFITTFLSPFLGHTLDIVGRKGLFLIISSVLLVISQMMFLFFPQCPDQTCSYHFFVILPMIFLGLFFSLMCTTAFASIALVTESRLVVIGYSLNSSFYNLGLTIMPIIIGSILVNNQIGTYKKCLWVFFSVGILSLIINITIYVMDKRGRNVLNQNQREKSVRISRNQGTSFDSTN